MTSITARPATLDDIAELVRLRAVMWSSEADIDLDAIPWREACADELHHRLSTAEPDWAAYVVDRVDYPGKLACCAVGSIEQRLASPVNLSAVRGHVFNVATDVDCRRRGYARAAMLGLLDWYRSRGVNYVTLNASVDGEPLYEQLGFSRTLDPAMRLRLTR